MSSLTRYRPIIREALAGDVKAYSAIRDTLGQTTKSEADLEEQKIRTAAVKTKTGQDDEEDDGFLQAFNDAADDWSDFVEEAEDADDEEETTDI